VAERASDFPTVSFLSPFSFVIKHSFTALHHGAKHLGISKALHVIYTPFPLFVQKIGSWALLIPPLLCFETVALRFLSLASQILLRLE
jgi:hypothetical protein